ncbi:MAG: hypothetical protein LM590_04405 [Thermofilum sp.]|nr:hypothetical protein [Thermofilum sp.]
MKYTLVWFKAFDLGKPLDAFKAGKKLLSSGLAEVMYWYDEKDMLQREFSKTVSFKEPVVLGDPHLTIDYDLLFQEYRSNRRLVRLKIRGFKARILDMNVEIKVYLMIHKTGFAVLGFWLPIDMALELEKLVDMVYVTENESMYVEGLWRPMVDRFKKLSIVEGYIREAGENKFYATINNIATLYVYYIILTLMNRLLRPFASPKMRYPYAEASMAVIISDIDNLQEFIQNHRKDLYILLTGSRLLQLVDNEKIKEVTDRNLSWRKDLYINISSSRMIVLFSKEVIDQIKNDFKTKIEKEPFADILNKVTEEIIDLHVLETELVPIFVWENLLLQEYMLRTYNYLLGENRPDSVRQLNKLREEISDAIEEYLNVRVWAFPYAREIVEKAKPIMSINELYDSLRKRLDFVESIITTHYNVSINRLLILLTIITAGLQLFEVPRIQVTQLTNLDSATIFVIAFFVTILLPIIVLRIFMDQRTHLRIEHDNDLHWRFAYLYVKPGKDFSINTSHASHIHGPINTSRIYVILQPTQEKLLTPDNTSPHGKRYRR